MTKFRVILAATVAACIIVIGAHAQYSGGSAAGVALQALTAGSGLTYPVGNIGITGEYVTNVAGGSNAIEICNNGHFSIGAQCTGGTPIGMFQLQSSPLDSSMQYAMNVDVGVEGFAVPIAGFHMQPRWYKSAAVTSKADGIVLEAPFTSNGSGSANITEEYTFRIVGPPSGGATVNEAFRLDAGGISMGGTTFASLGTPRNGNMIYCSDCTVANPCAAAGTGALAKRLNGAWVCN